MPQWISEDAYNAGSDFEGATSNFQPKLSLAQPSCMQFWSCRRDTNRYLIMPRSSPWAITVSRTQNLAGQFCTQGLADDERVHHRCSRHA